MTQRAEGAILDIFRTAIGILKDRVNEEQGADTSPKRIDRVPVSKQMQPQNWNTLCYILPWVPSLTLGSSYTSDGLLNLI